MDPDHAVGVNSDSVILICDDLPEHHISSSMLQLTIHLIDEKMTETIPYLQRRMPQKSLTI